MGTGKGHMFLRMLAPRQKVFWQQARPLAMLNRGSRWAAPSGWKDCAVLEG
ncbi:hypothetical protein CLV44_1347 [Marinobacterium halophilum]|uniref:Uncharacterized protein n=1 Tax=Marinobacterium halophilum TaxID=267374 RepID=A0A2P8EI93_9GAMM|nr:hypothetical protein CLV44_1347 [Marinobacterium halophilum]